LADSEELPPLPVSAIENAVEESGTQEKSFFDKVKDFLGFGSEEQMVKNELDDAVDLPEMSSIASVPEAQEESDKLSRDEIKEMNEKAPVSATADGPLVSSMNTTNVDLEELKLPEGFDEVLDIDEEKEEVSASIPASNQLGDSLELTEELETKLKLPEKANKPNISDSLEDLTIPELPAIQKESEAEIAENPAISLDVKEEKEDAGISELPKISNLDDVTKSLEEDEKVDKAVKNTDIAPAPDQLQDEDKQELDSDVVDLSAPDSATLPEPSYANKVPAGEESVVLKYQKERQAKQKGADSLPRISKEELVIGEDIKIEKFSAVRSAELTQEQAKFVDNEAQVLILPNDDIVLGKLTEDARLENIDLRSYLTVFWANYNKIKREPQRLQIDQFIDGYNEKFNKEDHLLSADKR